MTALGMTESLCPECGRLVPAKIVAADGNVFFRKYCPEHGERETFVRHDADDYAKVLRYVKPAWVPRAFTGDDTRPCPEGCGFCARHEQHLCMPILEITERCDLRCPVCLNDSGGDSGGDSGRGDWSVGELRAVLDSLLAAEPQIDVLNLSGGEPLLHPHLLDLIDECLSRDGIVRVSVSTNGLALLRSLSLVDELKRRDVVVSLQFDGFGDEVYSRLRGRPLTAEKTAVLELLRARDVTTSLTMTIAADVNESQLAPVLRHFFDAPHIVSLMLQPLAYLGRAENLPGRADRATIPSIIRQLAAAGVDPVRAEDFAPLPCSHPLCFSLAFYLMLDGGGAVSVNRLAEASTLMDALSNRVVFGLDAGEHERLKAMIYELWSGPVGAVPEGPSVLRTLKNLLKRLSAPRDGCCGFDPRGAFSDSERRVKSIFIHTFQDADTFDLARVRRCCQAYPQRDGRLLPACVRNNRPRHGAD